MKRTKSSGHLFKEVRSTVADGAGLLGLIIIAILSVQPALGAEFFGLGTLPGPDDMTVDAVSGDGTTAVGDNNGPFGSTWPTRWTFENGTPEAFLLPISGTFGQARAVSSDGEWIVGRYGPSGGPFVYSDGTGVVRLPIGGLPNAISADGSVIAGEITISVTAVLVRWVRDDQGRYQVDPLDNADFMFPTGISNDGSVIAGYSGSARCDPACEAFRWTEDTGLVGLGGLNGSGAPDSRAGGMSADGTVIVGRDRTQDGRWQAFRWTLQGGMQSLGTVEGTDSTSASAASADGSVIVGGFERPSPNGAFIWNAEDGMRRLEDVLVADFGLADQLAGWTLTGAKDISDDGLTIVGSGINPNGRVEAWVAILDPVPEPSALLLTVFGLALLVWRRPRDC